MFRTRILTIALAGLLLGACEDAASPMEPLASTGADDQLALVLDEATSQSATRDGSNGGGGSLFARLAEEIPGFAGLYRNGQCSVTVVLTDLSEEEHAIRVVKAAVEPLVERACPNGIRVDAVRGLYDFFELHRFHEAGQELLRIDGVRAVTISWQQNKIVVAIRARQVARLVLEALPTLGIPEDAVAFQGWGGGSRHGTAARRGS